MCPERTSSLIAIALAHCSLLVLAGAGVPAAATPAATGTPPAGFQLLPAPRPTATAAPQVQGPVDIEGPVPVAPRVIPTSRPAPAPTPTAAQRPLPTIQTPSPRPAQGIETRRFTPAARATSGQRISGEDSLPGTQPLPSSLDLTPAETAPDSLPAATSLPSLSDSAESPTGQGAVQTPAWVANWSLWLAGLAALVALLAGLFLMRLRRKPAFAGAAPIKPHVVRPPSPAPIPQPEPAAAPAPAPSPAPVPAKAEAGQEPPLPVSLEIIPAKLSRSMMNATLSCVIKVQNRTGQDFHNLEISGDLVTAHGKVPVSEQLADAATALAPLNTMSALTAGGIGEITANLILPISQIRPITQGRATLYVPLLRIRVMVGGHDPVTQTFVIGMKPPGSDRVQPFRLDEMAQTYSQIGSRALD